MSMGLQPVRDWTTADQPGGDVIHIELQKRGEGDLV